MKTRSLLNKTRREDAVPRPFPGGPIRPSRHGLVLILIWSANIATEQEVAPNRKSESQQSAAVKQESAKPNGQSRYSFRRIHDPNGIGKFYFGREIAHVMGYQAADWLERPEREKEERLSLLIKSLRLKSGMVVADIGAGSGVISFRIAEHVGANGTVLAVDVQQEMLDLVSKKSKKLRINNVKPIKGTPKSPQLKAATVDLAILVDVYHEFEFPYEMVSEISRSLKPGGRVAFVEYRKEDPSVPIKLVHKMSVAQVRKEIGQPQFGLQWVETIGVLPRQHIIVFERKPSRKSPNEP